MIFAYMISTSNKLFRPINFYPLNNLLQNITHLDILLVLLQHRLLQCYPSCFCQRFPQIQSKTNAFSNIFNDFKCIFFSMLPQGALVITLTYLVWLNRRYGCLSHVPIVPRITTQPPDFLHIFGTLVYIYV